MIEAKLKEQAIFKLYNKYPFLNCKRVNKEAATKKFKLNVKAMEWAMKCLQECQCCL